MDEAQQKSSGSLGFGGRDLAICHFHIRSLACPLLLDSCGAVI